MPIQIHPAHIIHWAVQDNILHAEIRKDSRNSLGADELGRNILYDVLEYLSGRPQVSGRYTSVAFSRLCREASGDYCFWAYCFWADGYGQE